MQIPIPQRIPVAAKVVSPIKIEQVDRIRSIDNHVPWVKVDVQYPLFDKDRDLPDDLIEEVAHPLLVGPAQLRKGRVVFDLPGDEPGSIERAPPIDPRQRFGRHPTEAAHPRQYRKLCLCTARPPPKIPIGDEIPKYAAAGVLLDDYRPDPLELNANDLSTTA
jgi:hypothetical protein